VQSVLPNTPLHTSAVQGLVSAVQGVPADFTTFAGQSTEAPLQFSAMSHSLTAALQITPVFPATCLQLGPPAVPSQVSTVHGLPSSVHNDPALFTVSIGHVALLPVHDSARSHSLSAARQSVPPARYLSTGHCTDTPSHISLSSQSPFTVRHVTDEGSGLQLPAIPDWLHDWQSLGSPPPQALSQQTPSTQLPDAHCTVPEQVVPSTCRALHVLVASSQ